MYRKKKVIIRVTMSEKVIIHEGNPGSESCCFPLRLSMTSTPEATADWFSNKE